jgi:hypothetical protein
MGAGILFILLMLTRPFYWPFIIVGYLIGCCLV